MGLQVMPHTHSTPFVVVCKCNLKSQNLSGFTRELLTASVKLLRKKEPQLFSRVLEQMLSVLLELLLCLFFTLKSLLPLLHPNKCGEWRMQETGSNFGYGERSTLLLTQIRVYSQL